jgi:hypothetical protein
MSGCFLAHVCGFMAVFTFLHAYLEGEVDFDSMGRILSVIETWTHKRHLCPDSEPERRLTLHGR